MDDLNTLTLPLLYTKLAESGLVRRLLELARDEDLGPKGLAGDVTSRVCPAQAQIEAGLICRENGVVAGLEVVEDLLDVFGGDISFDATATDGQHVKAGAVLGVVKGSKSAVLAIERTLLNIIGRLCGIATRTDQFVNAIQGGARLYDTRKTTPGLRMLEKYAVRCGGGFCHRMGLHDAVLIKDNHLAGVSVDDLSAFVSEAARKAWPLRAQEGLSFVEVEVDSIEQFERVLAVETGLVDLVLLDNMDTKQLREAVALRDRIGAEVLLEASGGVTLETVRQIAQSGVDRISVGGLTHQAVSLDLGLDIEAINA